MLMKALKTFRRGDNGETVSVGREFDCGDVLARTYEQRGMAVPAIAAPASGTLPMRNVAEDAGPFGAVGGETGENVPALLSPVDQAPPMSVSMQPKAVRTSSVSTSPGASRRGRTRSTHAMEHGGERETASPPSAD